MAHTLVKLPILLLQVAIYSLESLMFATLLIKSSLLGTRGVFQKSGIRYLAALGRGDKAQCL